MNQPVTKLNPPSPLSTLNGLDHLAAKLHTAKQLEDDARAARIACEQALVEAVGLKAEGSLSITGDRYKVTTTQPVTRSINKEAMVEIGRELPLDIFDTLFRPEPKLNTKFFKELEQHNPTLYKIAARAVTARPGKPSAKVEPINN